MLVFNIAANDSDAKIAAHYSRVLVITELAVSGTSLSYGLFTHTDTEIWPEI